MAFQDRLVLRLCLGLGEGHYHGFHLASQLLDLALARGLIDPGTLVPRAAILATLAGRAGSDVQQGAQDRYVSLNLAEIDQYGYLAAMLPPQLTEMHLLARHRGADLLAILRRAYRTMLLPELITFLSRVALEEADVAEAEADGAFSRVFPQVEPRVPDASCAPRIQHRVALALYASFLPEGAWRVADDWPVPPPTWASFLESAERRFLDLGLQLDQPPRMVLYLSFYGGLNIRTITRLFRCVGDRRSPADVARLLAETWRHVLEAW